MMSPTTTVSPEWQNENSLRSYPIADDAPAASLVPPWLLSDMRVTCSDEYDSVYVSSVYVSETLLSVGVSGKIGSNPPVGLLARTVTRDELEPHRAYSMDRMSDTASGTVAFGEVPPHAPFLKLSFGPDDAPLAQSAVVRAKVPGVSRIVDPYHGLAASGIIDLSGNGEFRTYADPSDPSTVVVAMADMYRDLSTSVCDSVPSFDTCGQTPVRSINGVAPTSEPTVVGGVTVPPGVIFIDFR